MEPLIDHLAEESIYNQSGEIIPINEKKKTDRKDAMRIDYIN